MDKKEFQVKMMFYIMAKAFEEELGFEKFNIVGRDVAVKEQIMTQMTAQQMQQQIQGAMGGGVGPQEGEVIPQEGMEEEPPLE